MSVEYVVEDWGGPRLWLVSIQTDLALCQVQFFALREEFDR